MDLKPNTLRRKVGFDTAIGRHCSTLAEMRLNLATAEGEQREILQANIARTEQVLGLLLIGAA
jgi:hypothetical protein